MLNLTTELLRAVLCFMKHMGEHYLKARYVICEDPWAFPFDLLLPFCKADTLRRDSEHDFFFGQSCLEMYELYVML
jgi:hypothetical protein